MTENTPANVLAPSSGASSIASIDYVVVSAEAVHGVAVGMLPRPGRLPLKNVTVLPTHLVLTGADGTVEAIGSADAPLAQDALIQATLPEGLTLVELDAETGQPIASTLVHA